MNQDDLLPMPLDSFIPLALVCHGWFWINIPTGPLWLSLIGPGVFLVLSGMMSILNGATQARHRLLTCLAGLAVTLVVLSPIAIRLFWKLP